MADPAAGADTPQAPSRLAGRENGERDPVVFLMGPTAAGKSAATLALARRWPIEIINVDSATLYRGMDIGTAKPGAEERAQAPHHLLDVLDPAETYSAARFRADALRLIAETQARGRLPVLAGGTMLYYKSLQEGLAQLPQADPALRADIEARAARLGWPALHAELQKLDPPTAARLAPNDSQRIQRALEVCISAGTPLSTLLAAQMSQTDPNTDGPALAPDVSHLDIIEISLEPGRRSELHARIAHRFDQMLEAGLVDEVARLRARGDLSLDLPSMRCVGYRQIWTYLDGDVALATAREQGIAATRQLAKRQLTWLRARPGRVIVDCMGEHTDSAVVDVLAGRLGSRYGHDA